MKNHTHSFTLVKYKVDIPNYSTWVCDCGAWKHVVHRKEDFIGDTYTTSEKAQYLADRHI